MWGDVRRVIGVRLGCGWEREGVLLVRCWVMGGARAYLLLGKRRAAVEAASPM